MAEIRRIIRDGLPVWKLQCPKCGMWGDVDDDQLHGRVSVDCPQCDFHETRDWLKEAN